MHNTNKQHPVKQSQALLLRATPVERLTQPLQHRPYTACRAETANQQRPLHVLPGLTRHLASRNTPIVAAPSAMHRRAVKQIVVLIVCEKSCVTLQPWRCGGVSDSHLSSSLSSQTPHTVLRMHAPCHTPEGTWRHNENQSQGPTVPVPRE
jgi:hypothetical protein